jgi:hypothetical protein
MLPPPQAGSATSALTTTAVNAHAPTFRNSFPLLGRTTHSGVSVTGDSRSPTKRSQAIPIVEPGVQTLQEAYTASMT